MRAGRDGVGRVEHVECDFHDLGDLQELDRGEILLVGSAVADDFRGEEKFGDIGIDAR
ncbi:hypothetical protein [Nocardia carnea]|uniref:hypothetical protein n=1 Tax=Nocardia carnea TaxID=37328 RepID=UPI002458C232|nr:hypothetical protein [Nocardia carnea]